MTVGQENARERFDCIFHAVIIGRDVVYIFFFSFPSLLLFLLPSSPLPPLPSPHPPLTCRRFDSWRQSGNVEGTWGQIRASLSRIGRIRRQKLRSTFDLFEENRRTFEPLNGITVCCFSRLFDCKTRRGTVGKKRDRDGRRRFVVDQSKFILIVGEWNRKRERERERERERKRERERRVESLEKFFLPWAKTSAGSQDILLGTG